MIRTSKALTQAKTYLLAYKSEKGWVGVALHNVLPVLLVGICLNVALLIRGVGWDGDSIINIAQFEKLLHPSLFGTPDPGASPKLLPIFLFGAFHWLTGSYAIHWLTIVLTAVAVGQLVHLPAERGGGWIWLTLPFISPLWIATILTADNPVLQFGFLILGVIKLMHFNYTRALVFLLLAELSRPGPSILIAFIILIPQVPAFGKTYGRLNNPIAA